MTLSNLTQWLDASAQGLDTGEQDAEQIVTRLAASGALAFGVPAGQGGCGDVVDALNAIAEVASHSLTAAFVFWGQRAFIEYLLHSDNARLRETLLPGLLSGELAGATGLSNAMKFLSGIEELGVKAAANAEGWELTGRLPWVTNLRKSGFVVAAAIELQGAKPFVAAIPDNLPGLERSEDFQLLGMQCSNTAALTLDRVDLPDKWLLAADAKPFLQAVRPAFLGMQCGMAIGLARASLDEARQLLGAHRSVLEADWASLDQRLERAAGQLRHGLRQGYFTQQPAALFRLRIELAEIATQAVQLELQASGGKAYVQPHGQAFARRFRESAFVPVVTPSLVQLRTELRKHGQDAAA
ncbi:MAG: acyl-CoA dehydrogenase [Gammaproteobacteria bacterium HGW-Gammaproteobacteria-11]|nr:MAG: acyl-CoA dehydrogenase [Gammaproteobacteria bacterium HGW-Gammaproteobacteria-11]